MSIAEKIAPKLPLTLFNILQILNLDLVPQKSKIHLACWNGSDDPLNLYLEGKFKEWQEEQNKRNFGREYIVSLIQMTNPEHWLFAGVYTTLGYKFDETTQRYYYDTVLIEESKELMGRLVIRFKRSIRQSYINGENWEDKLALHEILPVPLIVEEFPGYSHVVINKSKLDLIINQNVESWRGALSSVAGVYLICDTLAGRLYVGSATGDQGIWQRWVSYSKSGHGGNIDLKSVLDVNGIEYSSNFQFSILEIADTHASKEDILVRESHWKDVLCSRKFGYNKN